ncbi:MAG: HEAT repeat domain-containing protein [Desulfonauticus sp.]|nr:HEAT repeat domain-containing protein [Desulfonauticus sp.]
MALKKAKLQATEEQAVFDKDKRKYKRDFEGLIQALEQGDKNARRWAARDLAEYGEKAIDPLCNRLYHETDPAVQDAILSSLMEINKPPIGEKLIPLLRSDDAGLRNKVIDALRAMPELVELHVNNLIKDEDPDVRIFTINIIQELRHPMVPKWLLEVLERDDHINVVGTALDALAEIATPDMKDKILKVKDRFNDSYIHFVVDNIIRDL